MNEIIEEFRKAVLNESQELRNRTHTPYTTDVSDLVDYMLENYPQEEAELKGEVEQLIRVIDEYTGASYHLYTFHFGHWGLVRGSSGRSDLQIICPASFSLEQIRDKLKAILPVTREQAREAFTHVKTGMTSAEANRGLYFTGKTMLQLETLDRFFFDQDEKGT